MRLHVPDSDVEECGYRWLMNLMNLGSLMSCQQRSNAVVATH